MKLDLHHKHTGRCIACGKPTRLPVHAHCHKLVRDASHDRKLARQHRKAQKQYQAGYVPHFCRT